MPEQAKHGDSVVCRDAVARDDGFWTIHDRWQDASRSRTRGFSEACFVGVAPWRSTVHCG